MRKATYLIVSSAALALAAPLGATVIEDFEDGGFNAPWSATSGNTYIFNAGAAHDGALGAQGPSATPAWYYRTDAASNIGNGSVLSMWIKSNGLGRAYLGFGADATGANSFVLAFNTGQLIFQNNESYLFSAAVASAFAFTADKWYKASISFGPTIVGNLYDSDGTTLLSSLNASGLTRSGTGGVAVRGLGTSFDTIDVTSGAVPEPATWAMMILGFGFIGGAMRYRRRSTSVAFAN